MAEEKGAARDGEIVNDMPPNVRPLHRKERLEQEKEQEPKRPPSKEEQKRAQLEEKAALIQARIWTQQEERGEEAEEEQGRTTRIIRYELTTLGNANRLWHHYGHLLRYVAPQKMWIYFDEEQKRWREDRTNRIYDFAEQTIEGIKDEIMAAQSAEEVEEIWKHYIKSQSASGFSGLIKLAEHKLALGEEDLISSRQRLVTASGIVDLRSGEICPPETEDFGLHWTPVPYDPQAWCPRWEQFIAEVMGEDREMMAFLQRLAGYSATGFSSEQALLIFSGSGNNGKGVFVRTLTRALGDYACTLNPDFLSGRRYISHPTDVEQLRAARLAVAGELAKGDSLDEARVKMMTGGDILKARKIGRDFSAFEPTFTLVMATNNLPNVKSQDDGMWRRLVVVPWRKQWALPGREHMMPGLPTADLQLEETLKEELPGILRWCIEGAVQWFQQRLHFPRIVQEASLEYRKQQDSLAPFILEHIIPAPGARTNVTLVFKRYCAHQEAIGEPALPPGDFFPRMKLRYDVRHFRDGNCYLDIALKDTAPGGDPVKDVKAEEQE